MSETRLTVLVSGEFADSRRAELQSIAPQATIIPVSEGHDLASAIESADVVAGEVPPEALARARHLQWVHSWKAGPDTQLYDDFVARPVTLTCCKGNGAIPLAEHAMMLMLMLSRNAMRWIEAQRNRTWERSVHGELNGQTVGIVGTGHSGSDLAQKAKAFHMQVLGLRRSPQPTAGFDRIYGRDGLHDFLAASDFVVMTAPRTPHTENMLGEVEFRTMKPTAHYICFSRGGIANDDALYRALSEGWIAGAGLDAHDEEPLPPESRFWTAPNTIVTPHNGATTQQTRERGYAIFADNLRRFVAGQPLVNVVDKQNGY